MLSGKALYQIIIAPPARNRAELTLLSLFIDHFKGQLSLVDWPGIISQTAHDRGVNLDPVRAIALRVEQHRDLFEFIDTFCTRLRRAHQLAQPRAGRRPIRALGGDKAHDDVRLFLRQLCAIRERTAFILAPCPEQRAHAVLAKTVQLINRAHGDAPLRGLVIAHQLCGFEHAVHDLTVINPHQKLIPANARMFQRRRQHPADLSIRRDRRCADRISIALPKLAKAPWPRLFIAPHRTHRIAPIGRG